MKEPSTEPLRQDNAQEQLINRISSDFYDLHLQVTTGLQAVMELHEVAPEARAAVGEYMGAAVGTLAAMEREFVRMADALQPEYPMANVIEPIEMHESVIDPREHGHATLAALFAEIRHDEAARKHESSPEPLSPTRGTETAVPGKEPDDGPQR